MLPDAVQLHIIVSSATLEALINPAVVGENTTLTCSHNERVQPMLWVRGEGNIIAAIQVANSPCGMVAAASTPGLTDRYSYTCITNGTIFTLTIPAVNMTEDEHGVDWKCKLFSSGITSNGVTLYVEGNLLLLIMSN